jgi:hypothetical protein
VSEQEKVPVSIAELKPAVLAVLDELTDLEALNVDQLPRLNPAVAVEEIKKSVKEKSRKCFVMV